MRKAFQCDGIIMNTRNTMLLFMALLRPAIISMQMAPCQRLYEYVTLAAKWSRLSFWKMTSGVRNIIWLPDGPLCICGWRHFSEAIFECLSLQWRHNERDGASNHRRPDCLFNRLLRHRSKKTSNLHFAGHCEGNPPVTGRFPPQRASKAKNVSIWWRHRVLNKNFWYSNHVSLKYGRWCLINNEPALVKIMA